MTDGPDATTLCELRDYVQQTICEKQELLPGAFQLHEMLMTRRGKPCGLHFTLDGPRAVRYSAICDFDRRMVLFYDCSGVRFLECTLRATPRFAIASEYTPN